MPEHSQACFDVQTQRCVCPIENKGARVRAAGPALLAMLLRTEEDGEVVLAGYVLFVARCHGEVERQKLPWSWVRGLNFGMAFIPPNRLAGAEVRALPAARGISSTERAIRAAWTTPDGRAPR